MGEKRGPACLHRAACGYYPGGMVLARAIEDSALAVEIQQAARDADLRIAETAPERPKEPVATE